MKLSLLTLCTLLLTLSCRKKEPKPTTNSNSTIEYIAQFVGTSKISVQKTFYTGFETESDVSDFYVVPSPQVINSSAVNTYHGLTSEKKHGGQKSHKGWFTDVNPVVSGQNTNHRGYPTIQLYKTPDGTFNNLLFLEFWVYLDVSLVDEANKDWFSFATLCAYQDDQWQRTLLINLHKDGYIHLAHVPTQGEFTPNIYQSTTLLYPQQEWVKISAVIDYTSQNEHNQPYAKVWQNDQLVSASTFKPRLDCGDINSGYGSVACVDSLCDSEVEVEVFENTCGLEYTGGLAQAHFGLYAAPLLPSGTVYNDDLIIYELKKLP